jgi:Protein of unknown function (DUF3551)
MRILYLVLAILVVTAAIDTRAQAQNYPWCARYSTRDGATCGFTTFQQCMATISGIGGFCEPNFQYRPSAAWARRRSGF